MDDALSAGPVVCDMCETDIFCGHFAKGEETCCLACFGELEMPLDGFQPDFLFSPGRLLEIRANYLRHAKERGVHWDTSRLSEQGMRL